MSKPRRARRVRAADIALLAVAALPILCAVLLRVLTAPAEEGIQIHGAFIYFTVPLPLGGLPVTESQVNSLAVTLSVLFLCLFLTRGMTPRGGGNRQHFAEFIVGFTHKLVKNNMGESFSGFSPFIGAMMALSALSSLLSLLGLYPPTADINIVGGWALLVFFLITYYKMKCGPLHYLRSFADPPLLTPLNVISEVATPLSMAFRHYGNVLSGSVISVLLAAGLSGLSCLVLGWLPGVLGEFPLLRVGIPAILSLYFDLFSGCLQAYIFAMLTMLYVGGAFPAQDYAKMLEKRRARKEKKANRKVRQEAARLQVHQ